MNMKILISTTNRHVPYYEPSGNIFTYDLDKKVVIQKNTIIEVPYLKENPNPRGGMRGLKGFSIYQDKIAFVTSSTIFIYDNHWNPVSYFFHPSCAAIHELVLGEKEVWVTSTANDQLICFDYRGNLLKNFDCRKMQPVMDATGWKVKPFISDKEIRESSLNFRDPRTHEMVETDKAHINSIFRMANGDLLLSLGLLKNSDFSMLLGIKYKLLKYGIWQHVISVNAFLRKHIFTKVTETKGEMIIQPAKGHSVVIRLDKDLNIKVVLHYFGVSVPSHSARELADGSGIYLNSTDGELIHFNLDNGEIHWREKLGSKFLRGARELPDGTLLLGDGAAFLHYDLKNHIILSKNKFTEEPAPSVFDFCILPDGFEVPPKSFQELHDQYMPVKQI